MEARAVTRYVRVSASKARLVVDQIRGKNTDAALETLAYTQRAVAEVVEKTLNSRIVAVAATATIATTGGISNASS